MDIILRPEDKQFIEQQLKAGLFTSANDVVNAALERMRHDGLGEFDPGELDALVAEGEADIVRGDLVDGEEVFRRLRQKSAEHRQGTSTQR